MEQIYLNIRCGQHNGVKSFTVKNNIKLSEEEIENFKQAYNYFVKDGLL